MKTLSPHDSGPLLLEEISRHVGERAIIDRLSLSVEPGECLALLGPSGCGKSTILRLIAGLDSPSSGQIRLGDQTITSWPPARRRVGMVFQSYALYPHLDVWRNLTLGLEVRGVRPKEQREAVERVLSLLKLGETRHRLPAALSGGQRQRIALARALLRSPRLYLLDEPMSSLDAQLREDLRPQLRRWLCGGDQPVVYVTHDQQEAMGLADRIAVLLDGRLQQLGTPQQLYERPTSLFVASFVGRPQINAFPERGGRVLAVRPEHLHPCTDQGGGLPASVVAREWLGATQLLSVDTQEGRLRWLANGKISVPERLRLSWLPEHEHWFESGSGRRVEKAAGG